MAAWTFTAGDGEAEEHPLDPSSWSVTWRLREPSTATVSLDGNHPSAPLITERVSRLHVRRDKRRLFRGIFGRPRRSLNERGQSTEWPVGDLRARLEHLMLYDDDTLAFTGDDQSDIAWSVIEQVQAHTGGNLGITRGDGAVTGVTRDHEFPPGLFARAAVDQLATLDDGFDWDIDPDTLTFDIWYPQRGGGPAGAPVLDYGGVVESIEESPGDVDRANALRVNGADGLLDIEAVEVADIASRPEGRWDRQIGDPDILDADTLAARAVWELVEADTSTTAYTVTFTAERWVPTRMWLGDTVRLVARSGDMDVNDLLRIHEITASGSGDGGETVTAALGAPTADVRRTMREQAERLARLERH